MLKFLTSAADSAGWPDSERDVLLVGRSNVGKSTFINKLYAQKAAYVGKTPGKTRLLNFFDAGDYLLVDAPGYGYAKRTADEQLAYRDMMNEYLTEREALRLVILLVDARHKPSADDLQMMDYLRQAHLPVKVIATKADKLKNSEIRPAIRQICNALQIPENALTLSDPRRNELYLQIREEILQALRIA